MQAAQKFDPEKGFRLTTYAMWWIKAAMQEYILRSWSLVKIGTTAVQKKLFFNLRSAKNRIQAYEEGDLKPENLKKISDQLNVPEKEVINMNRRLSGGDPSLNATALKELLKGKVSPYRDIVLLNSGASLKVSGIVNDIRPVSYTHLRAHET